MRKLGISNAALNQLKRLPETDRQRAVQAIARLQKEAELNVHILSTKKAANFLTFEAGNLVLVLREMRNQLVVLSVFSHREVAGDAK